jgi:hypothetical protein
MQGQLEFHDSEVRSIDMQADALTIVFSAAYVRTPAAGAGYVQSLVMAFTGASLDGPRADGIGRLSHGMLWVDGVAQTALPFPYTTAGPVRVELRFSNGTHLNILATSLVCRLTGDPQFIESFAC